jgi:hypothetical protein
MDDKIKDTIITLLKEKKLTYQKIADYVNMSYPTIEKVARENNLKYGRGKRNFWTFSESNELAYLVGAYLTDGTLIREYKTRVVRGFAFINTSDKLLDHILMCLQKLGLPAKLSKPLSNSNLGKKIKRAIYCYSSDFGNWLYENCNLKERIPDFIFESSNEIKINLISALIDGDGSIAKDGSIRVRNTSGWISCLADLLNKCNIRNSGLLFVCTLKTGKKYYSVHINRNDFLSFNGFCIVPEKQSRLMLLDKPIYVCNVCGKTTRKDKRSLMCKQCANELKKIIKVR